MARIALLAAVLGSLAAASAAPAASLQGFADGVAARLNARGIPARSFPVEVTAAGLIITAAPMTVRDADVQDGRLFVAPNIAFYVRMGRDYPIVFRALAAALLRAREPATTDGWEAGVGRAVTEAVAIDEAVSWSARYRIPHDALTPRYQWVTRVRRWSIIGGRSAWTRPGAVVWRRGLLNADYMSRRALILAVAPY